MRIAIAQFAPVTGDVEGNVNKAIGIAREAEALGVDMLVFPHGFLTGPHLGGLIDSIEFYESCSKGVEFYASQTKVQTILPGASMVTKFLKAPEVFHITNGSTFPLIMGSFIHASLDAENALDVSDLIPVIQNDNIQVAVATDRSDASVEYNPDDIDVLIDIAQDPYTFGVPDSLLSSSVYRQNKAELATDIGAWTIVVNPVGAHDGLIYSGGSLVITPWGDVVAEAVEFAEQLLIYDIDINSEGTGEKPVVQTKPQTFESLYKALVLATSSYVLDNGAQDVVVGLSGGLDSSLVAAIAVDALGPEHVHGLIMPGPYSSKSSVTDAKELAENLGIETTTLSINSQYHASYAALDPVLTGGVSDPVSQNLQARIRGMMLMAYSNSTGAMVLNTANKSEVAVGYSTLYGDTVGAFAPISDVYKSDCFVLAETRNQSPLFEGAPIPENIITKPPSAELTDEQTDVNSLGVDYDSLDHILYLHIEENFGKGSIVAEGYDEALVSRILAMVKRSEYKRRQEPLGAIVSSRHLVTDRHWPLTNAWVDTSKDEDSQEDAQEQLSQDLSEALNQMMKSQSLTTLKLDKYFDADSAPPRPPRPTNRKDGSSDGDGFNWGMFFRN